MNSKSVETSHLVLVFSAGQLFVGRFEGYAINQLEADQYVTLKDARIVTQLQIATPTGIARDTPLIPLFSFFPQPVDVRVKPEAYVDLAQNEELYKAVVGALRSAEERESRMRAAQAGIVTATAIIEDKQ